METVTNILATFMQERKSENAVRKSQERLQLAVESQNQVIWDWDLLTRELWWSDAMQRVFGYGPDQTGLDPEFRRLKIHPDDWERIAQSLNACIQNGERKWSAMYRFLRADGSFSNVMDSALVLYNESGTAIRMVGGLREIIEKRRRRRHV